MPDITQQLGLEITVLSPLHIGSGRELLQGYDYVPRQGRTWRIDEDAVLEAALGGGQDLDQALMKRPASELLRPDDFSDGSDLFRYVIPGSPGAQAHGSRVVEQIKDVFDRPYLPGSSLKGALRTLLLWSAYHDAQRQPDLRRLNRGRNRASQPLERRIFGRDPNHDWLRALRVRDSAPLPPGENLALRTVRVYPTAGRGGSGLDVDVEAIQPGAVIHAALTLETYGFEAADASRLGWRGQRRRVQELTGLGKRYAGQRLMTEAQYFKTQGSPPGALRFCDGLIKRLLDAPDDTLFLQVGWGAGWESKTLGSSMLRQGDGPFERLLSRYRMTKERGRQPGDPFPRSRKLALVNGRPTQPMGWIAIRVTGLDAVEAVETPAQDEIAGQRRGRLKRFFPDRGYGFIEPAGGGSDVFVHVNGLADPAATLQEGQRLRFDVDQTDKGPRAVNVRVIG